MEIHLTFGGGHQRKSKIGLPVFDVFLLPGERGEICQALVALAAALTETENVRGREEEQQDERAKEPG